MADVLDHRRGINCVARDREIIGLPARARQRKVPPLLRIIHKTLLRHREHQLLPPAPLVRRDRFAAVCALTSEQS